MNECQHSSDSGKAVVIGSEHRNFYKLGFTFSDVMVFVGMYCLINWPTGINKLYKLCTFWVSVAFTCCNFFIT